MNNSPLVSYTKLSPCNSGQRTHAIDRITPHVIVGQLSVETIGACFDHSSAQASCNYGIGSDGRVMLCVPENQRSWCSSNSANDQRAVTIECASDKTHPYAVNNTVYNRLIDLCVDICQRNGKTKLLWLGGKGSTMADKSACENYKPKSDEMILTAHRFYANKACPGDFLYQRFSEIATKVTKRLGGDIQPIEDIKYKVRLTWDNEKSQKGAFINYDKAVECANENPGYTVFTLDGKGVYTSKGLLPVDAVIANQTKEKSLALLANLPDYKGLPESKEDYINKVSEIAVKLYPYTRFLPSVVIAQAFLENGGGVASDALELTKRSNLIGQKAELLVNTWQDQTVWDGTKFAKRTPEVYNGVPTTITAYFRIFPNYAYSILDYEMFITHAKIDSNRYKYRDLVGLLDPEEMITGISQRGYATGTTYISSVMRIINQYDLTKYDKQAIAALISGTAADENKATQDSTSSATSQVEKAVQWALDTAADPKFGYDQANRWGPNYDCSSFVITAFEQAGVKVKTAGATYTGDMYDVFIKCGFKDVTSSVNLSNGSGLIRGDVLLNKVKHTALYIGNGQIVHASRNENGGATGGASGDQDGKEITTRAYYNSPWDCVLRLDGVEPAPAQSKTTKVYRVQVGVFTQAVTRDSMIADIKQNLDFPCFYESSSGRYYVYCGSFQKKKIAKQRVKDLQAGGFEAVIKEVIV